MNNGQILKCVYCGGNDLQAVGDNFVCHHCNAQYPLIEDIPIILPEPKAALSGYLVDMDNTKKRMCHMIEVLEKFKSCEGIPSAIRRVEELVQGMSCNLRLVERQFSPIVKYSEDKKLDSDFLGWASVQTGLSFHGMLKYFYQDWFGIPEFSQINSTFGQAVEGYCSDRDSIAVLGAAACGLLYGMSSYFKKSYGVDLVLPTLLAAKRLIFGEPMSFHLETAEWKKVSLSPPSRPINEVRFIASNVMDLPFQDGSLSAVATQCVLNIIGDPMQLACEIHRALKPGGIWINFSHPVALISDPPGIFYRKLDELILLLQKVGFDSRRTETMRFNFLNTEAIEPKSSVTNSEVQCFALEKTFQSNQKYKYGHIKDLFQRKDNNVWSLIPCLADGKRTTLSYGKTFSSKEIRETAMLSVIDFCFDIPREYAIYLEDLLRQVDGQKTFRAIYDHLLSERPSLSELDFLRLMHCLSMDHHLIELRGL